jgi:hypothetical protein
MVFKIEVSKLVLYLLRKKKYKHVMIEGRLETYAHTNAIKNV